MQEFRFDCRHFSGHKPCRKSSVCHECTKYSPVKQRILLVLLRRLGDILICSPLTSRLKYLYPDSHISWLTSRECKRLVELNSKVDRVVEYGWESSVFLRNEHFDKVINFERTPAAAAIASDISATARYGLGYGSIENGLFPFDSNSEIFFSINTYPEYRNKSNNKSWIEIYFQSLNLEYKNESYQLDFRKLVDTRPYKLRSSYIILNIGASKEYKKWPLNNWLQLTKRLSSSGYKVMISGGPDEERDLFHLKDYFQQDEAVTVSTEMKTIDNFVLDIANAKILITADTFALHLGIAARTQTICLFGPSKPSEVVPENFDNVKIILNNLKCSPCGHSKTCEAPSGLCMPSISVETVFDKITQAENTTQ